MADLTSKPTSRRDPLRWLRWLARGWSLLSIAFLLLMLVGHLIDPEPGGPGPTPAEWVGIAMFPVGTVAGLVLAWRREGAGGVVTVASLAGFYLWMLILRGRWPGGPFFALVAAPGLLFLAYALLRRRRSDRRGRS